MCITLISGRYEDSSGQKRVAGSSGLKKSQHYPARFGRAVAECFLAHRAEVKKAMVQRQLDLYEHPLKEAKDPNRQA